MHPIVRRGHRQPRPQRLRVGSGDITAPPGSEVDERWQRLVLMRRYELASLEANNTHEYLYCFAHTTFLDHSIPVLT